MTKTANQARWFRPHRRAHRMVGGRGDGGCHTRHRYSDVLDRYSPGPSICSVHLVCGCDRRRNNPADPVVTGSGDMKCRGLVCTEAFV